jgi:hypothetical protein
MIVFIRMLAPVIAKGNDITMNIMLVIMVMRIHSQSIECTAKQFQVLGMRADMVRVSRTADVRIKA